AVLPFVLIVALVLIVAYIGIGVARGRKADPKSPWTLWEKLVYAVTLLSVSIPAVTAFGPMLQGEEVSGWALFAHMIGAGMFVFTLPVLAITWCEANRFDVRRVGERGRPVPRRFYWLPKAMFWILLAGGLIVSMTMLLSMLPLFGTSGLRELLDLHRYMGLVVVVALATHVSGVILQRLGRR
ncbi:MAG: hypothetical protein JJ992_20775, partial [Planctomycetes bacterium]|nr:hypothetical protein [Planctomycetota bacterium]